MMKTLILITLITLAACTNLTRHEHEKLQELKAQGITIDTPKGSWERPASPAAAGVMNLLPGFGNFYLAAGNSGQSEHYLYGFLNLLSWPISVVWGIPEAAIDATNINKRELIYYYTYNEQGKQELKMNHQGL